MFVRSSIRSNAAAAKLRRLSQAKKCYVIAAEYSFAVVFVCVESPLTNGLRCSQDDELLAQRGDVIEHVRPLYKVLVLSQKGFGSGARSGVGDQHLQRRVEGLKLIHLFVGTRSVVFVFYCHGNPIRIG